MSAKQNPCGVAGRVIVRLRNSRAKTSAKSHELAGAYEMRDELSREARAILAEWVTDCLPDGKDNEYVLLEDAFTRLGLNLEQEDSDA